MPIYRRIIAHFYDRVMRGFEANCLGSWRRELLADVHGTVVEIGAGTGANLAHYPTSISRLIMCEPDQAMRAQLAKKHQLHHAPAEILDCAAENLSMPDESVDFLVATLVFCSVDRPERATSEAFRVLKAGGCLIFLEHVAATHQPWLFFWQGFWQPLWKRLSCNCHLRRATADLLRQGGFALDMRETRFPGAPGIVAPLILGRALKPMPSGRKL